MAGKSANIATKPTKALTDEQIRAAARFAYELTKHPMFGRFPKPPQPEPRNTKRTKKSQAPPKPPDRQFALGEDEE